MTSTTKASSSTTRFDSEGYDLDALPSVVSSIAITDDSDKDNKSNDIVHELKSDQVVTDTTSSTAVPSTSSTTATTTNDTNPIISHAEQYKQEGNEYYKNHEWDKAYEKYTMAIDILSNDSKISGNDILIQKKQWEDQLHEKLRNEIRERDNSKLKTNNKDVVVENSNDSNKNTNSKTESNQQQQQNDHTSSSSVPETFVLDPPHPHGTLLAIYYCNRAATSMQMTPINSTTTSNSSSSSNEPSKRSSSAWYDDNDDNIEYDEHGTKKKGKNIHPKDKEAVQDCTIAIILNPKYVKAYIRRATIYEQRYNDTELALQDIIQAEIYDPKNRIIQNTKQRLEKLEAIRIEQLKTETMSKLKDLGNSILSNFGLSLDNFKAQQDPNTGSYNISFQQN